MVWDLVWFKKFIHVKEFVIFVGKLVCNVIFSKYVIIHHITKGVTELHTILIIGLY